MYVSFGRTSIDLKAACVSLAVYDMGLLRKLAKAFGGLSGEVVFQRAMDERACIDVVMYCCRSNAVKATAQ